ncbi:nitrate- and nitrite sensing domain-containing protein [Streptomyces sp. L2]|uniref:sensor histidine kinase n=1 Tax=Streptomyces sp. L2 TaxID=2162665 RepID=UPI001012C1AB|nr:nitrate- and nitrite sensing domain-containing protein [Streptomyces sp. L2]
MQKKRPRRTGRQTAPEGTGEQPPVGAGRPTHVRTRLIVAVAVVAAAVAGAGAPSVLTASSDLSDSQDLVTLATRTQDALTLAHSLADERDEVTSYVAAGRPKAKAPSEQRSARVDRQVEDLRADTDTPAALRHDLDGIAAVRRSALTGKTDALRTHQAYSALITELHRMADELAEQMPPRAGSGAYALAELDSAVQQSAAARGLLLAALNVPTSSQTVINPVTGLPSTTRTTTDADRKQRDALTAAAQQARLRSDAAVADFRETAPKAAVDSYDSTVTGPEVNSADTYLARLTDQPTLADSELTTSTKKLDAALSARVDLMRGVEAALYDHRTKDLEALRDDDVTALEIRIAVLGALMLVAVGLATAMARTLTRPLSVLRRGSARLAQSDDPAAQDPVTFTGRNDEFAQVVRSVNALHGHAVALHQRVATLETDRKHLVGQRQRMADAREALKAELSDAADQLQRLRTSISGTFVNLALRTLGLVERQLAVIEGLEEREQDPDRLATLFKLDHFATVMRRHSENLLVLAGTEHVQQHPGPVPLVDVVRAAVSEIERYERVRIAALPPHAHVAGFAADDLSHLLAELMENATSFSPPDLPVEVSGWLLESGEVMLSVQDEGIGMAAERLDRLNTRLTEFDPEAPYDQEGEDGLGLGLYVVARLAHRHGVRVQLRDPKQGGVTAVVVLPQSLLTGPPTAAVPPPATASGPTHTFTLPGAESEANSNVLHTRPKPVDPLVALAEHTAREAGEPAEAGQTGEPAAPEEFGQAGDAAAIAGAEEAGEAAGPAATDEAGEAGEAGGPAWTDEVGEPKKASEVGEFKKAGEAGEAGGPAAATEAGEAEKAEKAREAGGPAAIEELGTPWAADGQEAAAAPNQVTETHTRPESSEEPSTREPSRPKAPPETFAETTMELFLPDLAAPRQPEEAAQPGNGSSASAPAHPSAPGQPEEPAGPADGPSATDHAHPAVPAPATGESAAPHDARAAAGGEDAPLGPPAPGDESRTGTGESAAPHDARAAAGGEDAPLGPPAPGDESRTGTGESAAPHDARAAAGGEDAPLGTPAPGESRTGGAGGNGDRAEAGGEAVTSKGLPKRTPRITAPTAPPRQRPASLDAEALRRRLGGFRQGAQAGYRAVEEENRTEPVTGGPAEEASS